MIKVGIMLFKTSSDDIAWLHDGNDNLMIFKDIDAAVKCLMIDNEDMDEATIIESFIFKDVEDGYK